MNKEFIPYEQALALKELGFDEPCLAYYNKEVNFNLCWKSSSVEPYNHNDTNKYDSLSAPIFSQAFRWFRKKHNLHSNVKCINTTYNNHFRFEIESNSETLYCRNLFDTYEEAELACLRKLIQIVASQNTQNNSDKAF